VVNLNANPNAVPLVLPPALATLRAHRVVPAPTTVTPAVPDTGSPFGLGPGTMIVVPSTGADAERIGQMLATLLRPPTTFQLPVHRYDGPVPSGAIGLRLGGPADLGPEGYELVIASDSVRILANAPAGLFYGVQTLRQLLPAGVEAEHDAVRMANAWTVPRGRIVDKPRFQWRGAMLDVARHFFTVDEVEQFVDLLALYKLNTLHLHLSDDQGWRIQIKSRPKLTAVGGSSEVAGRGAGFYTQQDYAAIVRYAQERFVTIVPEIDMPAHTNAAIASYPEIGCSQPTPGIYGGTQPLGVYTGTRVGWSTLCPDSAATYRFVEDVIRELAAITPGPYLHLGGDEVHALSREQYTKFVERVEALAYKYGKTMVGWEEIARAHLRPTTIAQQWQRDTTIWPALRQGTRVIVSPGPKSYLDMKYTPSTELGLRWAAFIELRTAYDWDPITYLTGVPEQAVVGVEAALWSETIKNITAAEYLAMPRLPAVAEVAWTPPTGRDWESFRRRVAAHAPRWRLLGVNFYPSPQVDWEPAIP
jgi:hexosaminidase